LNTSGDGENSQSSTNASSRRICGVRSIGSVRGVCRPGSVAISERKIQANSYTGENQENYYHDHRDLGTFVHGLTSVLN
jgi:hypothetical protein